MLIWMLKRLVRKLLCVIHNTRVGFPENFMLFRELLFLTYFLRFILQVLFNFGILILSFNFEIILTEEKFNKRYIKTRHVKLLTKSLACKSIYTLRLHSKNKGILVIFLFIIKSGTLFMDRFI